MSGFIDNNAGENELITSDYPIFIMFYTLGNHFVLAKGPDFN